MPARKISSITNLVRARIEHALASGALSPGDRLPSTRELGKELNADPRTIAGAYHTLAEEGLTETRDRSGMFVSARNFIRAQPAPPPRELLVEFLLAGIRSGYPTREFVEHVAESAHASKVTAVVIADTIDQVEGIARELRVDYGMKTETILTAGLTPSARLPRSFSRAQLVIATGKNGPFVQRLCAQLGKHCVVIGLRQGVISDEWRALIRRELYIVVRDPAFAPILRFYLGDTSSASVRILVAGEDDLTVIPATAATYVTEAARQKLGKSRIPGVLIRPLSILADDTVRAILEFVVGRNTAPVRAG